MSGACNWRLVRYGVNRKENARREAPGVGAATECRAETIAGAQSRGTWSSPYPALTPLHYWISLTPLPSLPLLQRSTWPGMGKTLARQDIDNLELNLHKYNHKKRSRGHRSKPEGTWKTLDNEIEKNLQAWELATNSKILTNLTLDQKSGINWPAYHRVRLQFPQKEAQRNLEKQMNAWVARRRWHTESLEIGELWRRKWWCSRGERESLTGAIDSGHIFRV